MLACCRDKLYQNTLRLQYHDYWLRFHSPKLDPTTSTAHLNVRIIASTNSGDTLYLHYPGILKMNETVSKIIDAAEDAKATEYGDNEWFTTPVIETSSKEFKWLESTVLVGQGRWHIDEQGTAAEYEIYRLVN